MGWFLPVIYGAQLLYGAYRYFTKPKMKTGYKKQQLVFTNSNSEPVPVVYGQAKVTGNLILKEGDVNTTVSDVAFGLCEGEIESIDKVEVEGINISNNDDPDDATNYLGCSFSDYLGTDAQTADVRFTTANYTPNALENNFVLSTDADTPQDWRTNRLRMTASTMYAYMKFDLTDLPIASSADIVSAQIHTQIRITYRPLGETSWTVGYYKIADDSWDEDTITWNNKPALGDAISTSTNTYRDELKLNYVTCTQYVKDSIDASDRTITIAAHLTGNWQGYIVDRDGEHHPLLKVVYNASSTSCFRNTAYIAARFVDNETFNGDIEEVSVNVRGLKIRNWTGAAWQTTYNTNPAWVILDQLENTRYGAGIDESLINTATFKSIASYCDTTITNANGVGEKRFECDAVFNQRDSVKDRINDVLASFGGFIYYVDGLICLGVDTTGSSSHTFTEANIIEGSFSFAMADMSTMPNDINVMFFNRLDNFKTSYVNVKDDTLINTYGRNFEEIPLVCVSRYSQAARMALYYLYKPYYSQYVCSFRCSINHIDVAPGDLCAVTHSIPGWTAKVFRIVSVEETDDDNIALQCEEYDSTLYTTMETGIPEPPIEQTNLPNPKELPPDATNLTLLESYRILDDGTYQPVISATWTIPDYLYKRRYHVYWKLTADPDLIFWETTINAYSKIDVPNAGNYTVTIGTENILSGIKSDSGSWPSQTITVYGKTGYPTDCAFNDANCTYYRDVYLEWTPITDKDLAFYEVRVDDDFGDVDANLIYQGKGTSFTWIYPTLTSYTFYIKARDLTGNYSENYDTVAVAKSDPVMADITATFTGRDCILDWEHVVKHDFEHYQIQVYSDSDRLVLIRTDRVSSPPYIYTFDKNVLDNAGTPIRTVYFKITILCSRSQEDYKLTSGANAAPGAPAGLTLTAGAGKLFISWTAVADSDIISYNVYAKTTNPPTDLVGNVLGTNYTFDPEGENTYYVQVAGVDTFGEGTKCAAESETTNPYSLTGYSFDVPITDGIVFSIDGNNVDWTGGTLYYKGTSHTIVAGTSAEEIIYWDLDTPTVFAGADAGSPPALDADIWVMAYHDTDADTVSAAFAQKIIHGGLIQASSIQATKMSVTSLSAISAALGTVTSGTMQSAASGQRAVIDGSTNTFKFYNAANVNVLKIDDSIGGVAPGIEMVSATGGRIYIRDSDTPSTDNSIYTHNSIAINSSGGGSPVAVIQTGESTAHGQIRVDYDHPSAGIFFEGVASSDTKITIASDGDIVTDGSIDAADDVTIGDKLIFNRAQDITIDVAAAAAPRTYTIPEAGAAASFVMTEGAQTVNGVKTFGSFPLTPSSAPTTDYQVANKKFVDDHAPSAHNVLSASHGDSLTGTVVRGDVIIGNSTPKWSRLAKGTSGYVLTAGASDVSWAAPTAGAAGSDTQVQFNDGGTALGGDAEFTYNKTTNRITTWSALLGAEVAFTTSSTDYANQDGVLLTNTQDAGENNLGSSIAFSKHGTTSRHCAIVAKQTGSDSDQMGLEIFTHPSTTSSDAMVAAIEIDHNGHITLENSATVFKEECVPFNKFKLRGTNDPSFSAITSTCYCYSFDYGVTDEIYGAIKLPNDYKAGTTLYPHIHRRLDATPDATTDDFRIGLAYTWCEEDGTMAGETVAELEITVGADSDTKLIRSELTSISGSGKNPRSTLVFRLYREPIVTGVDTESGVWITSLDFQYEADKLGSDATTV